MLVIPKLNWFVWLFWPISRAGKIVNGPPAEFVPASAGSSELRYTNSVEVHVGLATLMLKSSKYPSADAPEFLAAASIFT